MSAHDEVRLSLGAYALGTLEPADERAVEAHLASCPACLAELDELGAVLPSLERVSMEDLARPEPSPGLFDRITGAVDASTAGEPATAATPPTGQRAPRRRWLLAVAASVLVLGGAGTAIGFAVSDTPHTTTASATATANGIRLAVDASDAEHGTRLVLTVSGLPAHEKCHLLALGADGRFHDAGWWDASYDGEAKVVESTDVPRSELRGLTLLGNGGKKLVEDDI